MFQLDRGLLIVIERIWISKLLCCVTWKIATQEPVALVIIWVIILVFANWTVLSLEETFLSMCQSSRVIMFRFNSKTQGQMLLLLYGRHVSVPQKDTNLTWRLHTKLYRFGWHNSANNARMKQNEQQRPDSWGGCLYINHLSYPRFLTVFIEWLWF